MATKGYLLFRDGFGFSSPPTTDIDAPVKSIVISGANFDIDTGSVPEDFTPEGGTFSFLTSSDTLSIVSTSANDTLGGTGANVVLIEGLDNEYRQIFEVINLNGLTPVTSVNSYLRVNQFRVIFSGSGQTNAGVITAEDSTTGTVNLGYMSIGSSFMKRLLYTVPATHELFLTNTTFSAARTATNVICTASSRVYVPSTNTIVDGIDFEFSTNSGRNTINSLESMPRIPEKSDFYYRINSVSTNNVKATGTIRGLLVYKSWIPKFSR
jgi:hypothetical protein